MKLFLTTLFFIVSFTIKAQYINLTESEVTMIARLIVGEAEGESFEGKKYIAETILNRMISDKFPNTVEAVIEQPRQYDARWNASLWDRKPGEEDIRAVREALINPSLPIDVVYYVKLSTLPENNLWRKRLEELGIYKKEGAHTFFYGFEDHTETKRPKVNTIPKGMAEIKMAVDNTAVKSIKF
jgi:spore germination cell wall hydrolase CwlJ-like protein